MKVVLMGLFVALLIALSVASGNSTTVAQVAATPTLPVCEYVPLATRPPGATPLPVGPCENWKPTYRRYLPVVTAE